ncbi:MAG: hypothetical protein U0230_14055 [Polyangiales bacterium]
MASDVQTTPPSDELSAQDFSLVAGGPVYQLLHRSKLLHPPLELVKRRIAFFVLVVYVPLVVMTLIHGRAFGGVRIPLFRDWDAHIRLLFSLPMLIYAEKLVHERLRVYVRAFVDAGIVRVEERSHFDALVASTVKWRNSVVVETLLLVVVWTVGRLLWIDELAVDEPTWFKTPREGSLGLTAAGFYYAWLSVPIFQFLLFRWWYRLALWAIFLFRVSRLRLHLSPLHPDGVGGLEFLGSSTVAFTPVLAAQTALVASMIAGRVFHEGAHLQDFQVEIAMAFAFVLLQVLGPLFVFTPKLLEARRHGLHEVGLLAGRYTRQFEEKYLEGDPTGRDLLAGSDDIMGLGALQDTLETMEEIRPIPFTKEIVFELVFTCGLPMLPLITTVIPGQELVERLAEALF